MRGKKTLELAEPVGGEWEASQTRAISTLRNDLWGFPGGSGKEATCQCRRQESDPWSGKTPRALEQLNPWATTSKPVF